MGLANQRTRASLADGSFWVYEYDVLGRVTSGKRYWADGTPVAGQQFEYGFDDIGNRASTKAGGDQTGASLRAAAYTNNTLNQITGRGVPGAVDVIGIATPAAVVTVNSSNIGIYRRNDYFRKELAVSNGSGPVWQSVSVSAQNGTTNTTWPTGNLLVPPAGQTFQCDADGNLTNDTVWVYSWDAENRLVQMTNTTALPTAARKKLVFSYDDRGRRIRKTAYPWGTSDYSTAATLDLKFIYDDWNLLAELNGTNNAVVRAYVWGLDLSGSEQGAGGVGGLLLIKPTGQNPQFPACDGNGNVVGLVDATSGAATTQYECGPFAEPIRTSGVPAVANPFRFSTKYTDPETDLLYYGYRYYSPALGRWLSRDPSQNLRDAHAYAFARNSPLNAVDRLGLTALDVVRGALWKAYESLNASEAVATTGFVPATVKLRWTTYLINGVFKQIRNRGEYDPNTHTIFVDPGGLGTDTAIHEMVHAFNDVQLHWPAKSPEWDRLDEGQAYYLAKFYSVAIDLSLMEQVVAHRGCDAAYRILSYAWPDFWREFGTIPGSGWGTGSGAYCGAFDLDKIDAVLARIDHHVQLSCSAVAQVLNRSLTLNGCCFRLGCGDVLPGTINPWNELDSIFK